MHQPTPVDPNIPRDNEPPRRLYSRAPRHESASPTPQTADNRESEIPRPDSTSLPRASQFPQLSSPPARPPLPAFPGKHASLRQPPPPNAGDGNTAETPPRSRPRPLKPRSSRTLAAQQRAAKHQSPNTLYPFASCRTPRALCPAGPETYRPAPPRAPHPSPRGW